jgi:hypothetical protein
MTREVDGEKGRRRYDEEYGTAQKTKNGGGMDDAEEIKSTRRQSHAAAID